MYSYSIEENVATIKMHKEALGGEDAMYFAEVIKKLPPEVETLILDMSQLELMNSSGIGMLAKTSVDLKSKNITLELINVNPNIMHLLEITQLNKIFTVI